MRQLSCALLQRRIHENPVRITIPVGSKAGTEIVELHLLDNHAIENLRVTRVVVKNQTMTILFSGPHVRPVLPVTFVAKVHGEQTMEVRKTFLSKKVQSES